MPKSEMAAEIRARVKRGFGIEDIDAKVSNMYNTPYHLSRHGDEDENILELFSSMKFGVRNRYQAGGTVARKLFAMEAQENMVADVKKICTKSVGIRYPSNGYQEDYEPATFSASQRFSLLQIGEVHWESRSTPMYVHPLDVIAYRPDITDYFNGRPFVLNRVEMR